jgi:hypothetical protein
MDRWIDRLPSGRRARARRLVVEVLAASRGCRCDDEELRGGVLERGRLRQQKMDGVTCTCLA